MPNQINNHYRLVQTAAHSILSEPCNICVSVASFAGFRLITIDHNYQNTGGWSYNSVTVIKTLKI